MSERIDIAWLESIGGRRDPWTPSGYRDVPISSVVPGYGVVLRVRGMSGDWKETRGLLIELYEQRAFQRFCGLTFRSRTDVASMGLSLKRCFSRKG